MVCGTVVNYQTDCLSCGISDIYIKDYSLPAYVMHCLVMNRYQYFRRTCFLHILGGRAPTKLYDFTYRINALDNHGRENQIFFLFYLFF